MRCIISFACLVLSVFNCFCCTHPAARDAQPDEAVEVELTENHAGNEQLYAHLKAKAEQARQYSKKKGFSEAYCILINFSIHSGKNRFFIWDFAQDTVLFSSLCAHGSGKGSTEAKPEYSNVEGSYCSSLGRYRVGISSYSQYGIHIHYKLHGLDATNSNAFKRIVVLHSYQYVPDFEIYPAHLPLGYSLGCPVISDPIMRETDKILKKSEKSVLLWLYDSPID